VFDVGSGKATVWFAEPEPSEGLRADGLTAVATAESGQAGQAGVAPWAGRGYRVTFDYTPPDSGEEDRVHLSLLRGTECVSETWSYRWTKPSDSTNP